MALRCTGPHAKDTVTAINSLWLSTQNGWVHMRSILRHTQQIWSVLWLAQAVQCRRYFPYQQTNSAKKGHTHSPTAFYSFHHTIFLSTTVFFIYSPRRWCCFFRSEDCCIFLTRNVKFCSYFLPFAEYSSFSLFFLKKIDLIFVKLTNRSICHWISPQKTVCTQYSEARECRNSENVLSERKPIDENGLCCVHD